MVRLKKPMKRANKAMFLAAVAGFGLMALMGLVDNPGARADAEPQTTGTALESELCRDVGRWIDPETQNRLTNRDVLAGAARSQVLLLGETHTSKEDHLWQLQTLAGLYALTPELVIGFEAFPRSVQPVLDDWSAGKLSEDDFLRQTKWAEVWAYDADLYMPLFDFARQNRIPMIALNVDRGLISRVGRNGWDAVPEDAREGITTPAAALPAYSESLASVYLAATAHRRDASKDVQTVEDVLETDGFQNFVDAQLTWDRAMAEALAQSAEANPDAVVVGIAGRGHVERGFGIPHQLEDLGISAVTSLVTVDRERACAGLEPDVADAVFLVEDRGKNAPVPNRPRLGVAIQPGPDGGLLLSEVVTGSIAEAADLTAGDIVLSAAGAELTTPSDLVEIIQRQAPGTWLPLDVDRNGERLTLIAKFPSDRDSVQ
ncbi:ChaN family lipoprotein [Roseibium alexandrii]|uniref:Putative iron-regulated protein n=1 Tax=Roseibium alexandrii (strain DSM 17067 / NCIMB 14079 / DFL-11) TaxID=244592 RepID=A0A5E8H6C3_ROSAD|nr:ChaN family lipoprotein [Roseibium alexandrii]EEE48058.1 putative iron-regulated protein [Roseibium alexandrii DFL-11]